MNANLTLLTQLRPRHAGTPRLVACSLCLRVRRGSSWVEAEEVIRALRTYDLAGPPRLAAGICDHCTEAVCARRARVDDGSIAA